MSEITVIQGEIFRDERGVITSLNDFHLEGVRRTYYIHHPDETVVRGWHGHQYERKWFYCVKGRFSVAIVEPDDWDNPSLDLKAEIFHLSEEDSKIVCVPAGRANCLKAHVPGSIMQVFSDKILPDAYADSWRYDKTMWVDWEECMD